MSNKLKYFLDTSIFYELFKLDQKDFDELLVKYADGRRFAAYYTVIELNRGFLQAMVEHYKKVLELKNIRAALNVMGNSYGARKPTYAVILEGYLLDACGPISNDYRIYTPQLETAIADMTDRIQQLVRRFVGHFENHALAALSLYSSDDYDDFLNACSTGTIVGLEDFWLDYDSQLYTIRDKIINKSRVRILSQKDIGLLEFLELAMGGDVLTDSRAYEHTSDFVISLECPSDRIVVAHDHIFDYLVPLQDKSGGFVSFTKA